MTWTAVFIVLVLSHMVGDFALQTDWQAINKRGGLGSDALARRALRRHLLSYGAAFMPACIWIAGEVSILAAIVVAVAVVVPHLIQDDRRLLERFAVEVKGTDPDAEPVVMLMLDQVFHAVALFATALVVPFL